MKVETISTSVILITLVTLAGFQNCSKVNFTATGDLTGKTGRLSDTEFPKDEPVTVITTEDPVTNDDAIPNIENLEGDCATFAAGTLEIEGISQSSVVIHKHEGTLVIKDSDTLDLTNIRGIVMAKTRDADHLRNMRGDLCLVGGSEAASLGHLNNHRGNIEIIGMQTAKINNTGGTLVINGGSVDLIINHEGDIILKNGASVGEIREHKNGTLSNLNLLADGS